MAEKLKVTLRDQWQARTIAIGRKTARQFLDRWLAQVVSQRVRESTFQSDGSYVRLHLKPTIGHLQLVQVGRQDVQAMLNEKSRALSPRFVQ